MYISDVKLVQDIYHMYLKLLDVKLIEVLYDRLSGTGTCTNNFSYYINIK